jgi:CBS-domain-containing membrane protein
MVGWSSCATASTVMAITKTIHPPAGGTALIAATHADIRVTGWYYVPIVLLSAVLMIAVGLITNNIQRRYPMYWWTSLPLNPAQ